MTSALVWVGWFPWCKVCIYVVNFVAEYLQWFNMVTFVATLKHSPNCMHDEVSSCNNIAQNAFLSRLLCSILVLLTLDPEQPEGRFSFRISAVLALCFCLHCSKERSHSVWVIWWLLTWHVFDQLVRTTLLSIEVVVQLSVFELKGHMIELVRFRCEYIVCWKTIQVFIFCSIKWKGACMCRSCLFSFSFFLFFRGIGVGSSGCFGSCRWVKSIIHEHEVS